MKRTVVNTDSMGSDSWKALSVNVENAGTSRICIPPATQVAHLVLVRNITPPISVEMSHKTTDEQKN